MFYGLYIYCDRVSIYTMELCTIEIDLRKYLRHH